MIPSMVYSVSRKNFFLGNFSESIAFAKKVKRSDKDFYSKSLIYMYRSLLKKDLCNQVIQEIDANEEVSELECVKILAQLQSGADSLESCVDRLKALDGSCKAYPDLNRIILALVYISVQKYAESLHVLSKSCDLESLSLCIFSLLQLNQENLALSRMEKMKAIDEDDILTQITCCLCYLRCRVKEEEVKKILAELIQTNRSNPFLLSLKSLYYLNKYKFEKADEFLQEALLMDPLNSGFLFNSCSIMFFKQAKCSQIDEVFRSLITSKPIHFIAQAYDNKSREFDDLCLKYSKNPQGVD